MDGVNILNVLPGYEVLAIVLGVIFILLAIIAFIIRICDGSFIGSGIILIAIVYLLGGSLLLYIGLKDANTKQYEVTVEDTVTFNDFTEKYEIVEQNGKIWTVKEKKCKE